ncbi:tyrosine-type recombinase/integrase [Streptomyces antibioticus]|uniref:tyrosine-type recombinase/integrase n=1 Tax=Streptomyces antibioticus TaxID=1890 RepID=UPI0022527F16|nr:site-specific integrase [Streptomyces antibioticus]MCX4742791.1 site-specific integrase [Streptomyces antibioticus]
MVRRNANGEGSIYQRTSDKRWVGSVWVQTTSGKPKRVYAYGRTRAEVHKRLTEAKSKDSQGIPTADKIWRLDAYLDYWLEAVVKPNRRPATYAQCETIVRIYLKPGLGSRNLGTLSVSIVQGYLNQLLADGHSVSKTHVIRKVLSAALTRAEREELTSRNPARLVELPAEERKEVKPWSATEAIEFLNAVRSHRLYPAFLMLLLYGLRKGEVLGLRWQDIDFNSSKIHLRQQLQRVGREILQGPLKTAKSRRDLPLLDPVVEALTQLRGQRPEADLVFTTSEGTYVDPGNFLRDFQRLCRQHGLRVITVHQIRHTVATLLKSFGVADRDIQLILGHSRIVTTQEIYQHDDADSRRNVLQGLASALLVGSGDTKTAPIERSGLSVDSVDSNGSCQNGCQGPSFRDRVTSIISGGAYRIRTDDLFHAMTKQTTLVSRITEVDEVWKVRRRQQMLGVVAVSVAVKDAEDDNARLAALIAATNPPPATSP